MADQVLHSGVRSITDLMVLPGLINLDFADVRTVMTEMGKAMMGTGEATGEDRALMAAQNAIANPLLDEISLKGAKAVLVNVTGGLDMTLLEVDEAANAISDQVDPEANIIFGAAFDPSLDGKIRVSVVATGMDGQSMAAIEPKTTRTTVSTASLSTREPAPAPSASAPARPPIYAQTAPGALAPAPTARPLAPSPQPASFGDPRRGAYDAAPAVQSERPAAPEAETSSYAQVDLYASESEIKAPAAQAAESERPIARAEPNDSPLFPDRPPGEERHHKGGWLSLFGGRGRQEPAPLRDYRSDPGPVLAARAASMSQPAPAPAEDEHLDSGDELEIPSFLRRLAN